jgi:general secretion pathway protein G
MTRPAAPRRRLGFTLVELLVVLLIIALLIALLIPAIAAAVRQARSGAVQAEISQLATALADFKNKFGDYPPSRIVLNEAGIVPGATATPVPSGGDPVSGTAADITLTQLGTRTLSAFRKFWPRVLLTTSPAGIPNLSTSNYYDFNGDGVYAGLQVFYVLQGHECLVFFLGGIPLQNNGLISMTGFGKNPTNPFTNSIVGNVMYNGNRNPPLYDFASDRLVLTKAYQTTAPAYTAGFSTGNPGYLDATGSQGATATAQNFYAYFSNNNGAGYDPNDINFENPQYETDASSLHPLTLMFYDPLAVTGAGATAGATLSPSPNPYTTGPAFGGANLTFINAQSFQIISPGVDGGYGVGGVYNANGSGGVYLAPNVNPTTAASLTNSSDPAIRTMERDNLTNFHNGRLE